MKAGDRFRKNPVTLLKISKNGEKRYRTFKKYVREGCRTFGEKIRS